MKENIIEKVSGFLYPFILICFLAIITIFVIRFIFYLVITVLSRFYLINKNKLKEQRMQPRSNVVIYKKNDEELLRNKEIENMQKDLLKLNNVDKINQDFEDKIGSVSGSGRIVGIVKPVGFWTSLILGDQLSKIFGKAKLLNKRSGKGFWISMLETQSRMIEKGVER